MLRQLITILITLSMLFFSYMCIVEAEFHYGYNALKISEILIEIDSIDDKTLSVGRVIGDIDVKYWDHVINDVYIKNDSILLQVDSKNHNLITYDKSWTEINVEEFDFTEIMIEDFFWKEKVIFPEEDDCENFYSFYEKQDYPIACWEVRYKDGTTKLYDFYYGYEIGEGIPSPSDSFLMTGPHQGKDVWNYLRNNAESYYSKWSNSTVSIFNPNTRKTLSENVSNPNVELFYEIAHGSHRSFSASTSGRYYSYHSSEPNVREDMKNRPPMKFAFIGSCGGMDKTDNGSFSYEFRKGEMENTVTVGYTGMGDDDGWPKAKPWQDTMFSQIENGSTIKDAFDFASAQYPKIADAVKFVGDENLRIVNLPPYDATAPYPPDNATGVPPSPTLSVLINDPPDPDGDSVDVFFIGLLTNESIGAVRNVTQGGRVQVKWDNATKPGGVYYWEVWVVDSFLLPVNSSEILSFKIDLPPDKPKNPRPFDNERYVNTSPILSVDVSDPDGDNMTVTFYDANGNRKIGSVDNAQSGETVSITWDDLDYGTTYRWYVVADDGIFDNRSKDFTFTTNYLPVFSNIFPENGSDDVSCDIDKLSIEIIDSDGDSFDWDISVIPDIGSKQSNDDFNGSKYCYVSGLLPDTEYIWTVTAIDSRDVFTKAVYNFKTKKNIAPEKPIFISPRNSAMDVGFILSLNWSCVDPDGDTDLVYDVYFGKNINPPLIIEKTIDTNYKILYDLDFDTMYYWKVVVTDSYSLSTEGDVWSFKTSSTPPPPNVGSINISFPKKYYRTGVKFNIINEGDSDASNVFWNVSISGGIFNRVNVSKSGYINRLNCSEECEISTCKPFNLNFDSMLFGFGGIEIKVEITDKGGKMINTKVIDSLIIGRNVFLFRLKN